ncbi:Hypothetical protein D9617_2g057550 [Elsinoe fawcettii]|nr:Hypothetical protein D9617_2g057550 [Elsinoe fawcettii]
MSSTWASFRAMVKHGRVRMLPSGDVVSKVPVLDMLAHNWHLAYTSFGGPTVHFQIFRKTFVDDYKWIDETTYQEMFAICQALSGPASTKMIYGINVLHYGFWIGLLSLLTWSLPMAVAAFGLATGVSNIGEQLPGPVYALLSGLNAATVGIVALAGVELSRKAITDTLTRVLVFLGGAAGMLYNALWYFPILMVAGGMTTLTWDLRLPQRTWRHMRMNKRTRQLPSEEGIRLEQIDPFHAQSSQLRARAYNQTRDERSTMSASQEETAVTVSTTNKSRIAASWKAGTTIIGCFLASFIIVMVCRGLYSGRDRGFDLFANLYLAGTIIFGGGPVVIPLLSQYTVSPGWVSPRDFLLGLAVMQAFPGPNFNFAVYLGTLAVRDTPIPAVAGAVIAYLAIFAPGIWLYTGFMGLWTKVRRYQAVRACLRGVHATAVGLVFSAVYRLFEIGYLDENVQGGGTLSRDPWWIVILATSFLGGMHFNVSPPIAIVLGAVMGLIWYAVVRS